MWLAKDPEGTTLHVLFDQRAHLCRVQVTRRRDVVDLGHRTGLGDVGVEATEVGGDEVNRNHGTGGKIVLLADLRNGFADPVDEHLIRWGQVAARRVLRVVGVGLGRIADVGGGRRPAEEVFRVGEVLADQPGADQLAVLGDEAAVCLVVKDHLGDTGDQEGINQAGDDRDHQREASRTQQLGRE